MSLISLSDCLLILVCVFRFLFDTSTGEEVETTQGVTSLSGPQSAHRVPHKMSTPESSLSVSERVNRQGVYKAEDNRSVVPLSS